MLFNNSNIMTKSSNFASVVKVSFHEFQVLIGCKFPLYAVNLYCMCSTGNIRKAIKAIKAKWVTVIAIVMILKLSSITLILLSTISYNTTTLSLMKKTNAFMNTYGTGVCISPDEYFLKCYSSDIFQFC